MSRQCNFCKGQEKRIQPLYESDREGRMLEYANCMLPCRHCNLKNMTSKEKKP
jgi:hypothetical protein